MSHACPVDLVGGTGRVTDPRSPQGTRYPLPAILGLTVLAILCGCKSCTAIA
ncbi:MAG TPA: transposase family protein [Gemmataceae bacterium]|nr:transposase family protein [Gemmataceae bacterium]